MTPATNAIVSLAARGQAGRGLGGERHHPGDRHRARHRHHGQHVQQRLPRTASTATWPGCPTDVADQAREAPGLALAGRPATSARAGDALAAAARDAFASGMRFSMLIGAGLLLAGALFLAWRGPSRDQEALEDVVDLDLDARRSSRPRRPRRSSPRRLPWSAVGGWVPGVGAGLVEEDAHGFAPDGGEGVGAPLADAHGHRRELVLVEPAHVPGLERVRAAARRRWPGTGTRWSRAGCG